MSRIATTEEIPPRARRRAAVSHFDGGSVGNTSACAEKRTATSYHSRSAWKYLRVRGEENGWAFTLKPVMEIPPRARRRAPLRGLCARCGGNTSACAEKRLRSGRRFLLARKYLRVRGEELCVKYAEPRGEEIPPRARRRAVAQQVQASLEGNTSACAEKSPVWIRSFQATGKYLRVRGEEHFRDDMPVDKQEIPPRARRRAFLNSNFSLSRCGFAYVLAKTCTQVKGRPCQ